MMVRINETRFAIWTKFDLNKRKNLMVRLAERLK